MKRIMLFILCAALLLPTCACAGRKPANNEVNDLKPVIYLYPEETTEVTVELLYDGTVTATYPVADGSWHVTAHPDGTLQKDGRTYTCLFWEGRRNVEYDFSEGFCVAAQDSVAFLQDHLEKMGLEEKEYNEMIVYWLPVLLEHPYNLISFQQECYTDGAQLKIDPEPDSVLRVFMAVKPLDAPVSIREQNMEPFERTGFCVVEWGGAVVR